MMIGMIPFLFAQAVQAPAPAPTGPLPPRNGSIACVLTDSATNRIEWNLEFEVADGTRNLSAEASSEGSDGLNGTFTGQWGIGEMSLTKVDADHTVMSRFYLRGREQIDGAVALRIFSSKQSSFAVFAGHCSGMASYLRPSS